MSRLVVLMAIAAVSLGSSATAIEAPATPSDATTPSAATYDALIAKAQGGDTHVDYTLLRMSYPMTDHYDPYRTQTGALFEQAWRAVQAKDCKTVFEKTNALLKIEYTNIDAHAFLIDCYNQAGDSASANRELAIGRGLAQSLMASGDGKSADTAYRVVTLREEGFVMGSFDAHEESQSLVNKGGHLFDVLTGTNAKTGETVSLFFNVDPIFGSLAHKFDGKPAP